MLWFTGSATEGLPFIHDSFPVNPKAVHHQRKKPPFQQTTQQHQHGDNKDATTTKTHGNATTTTITTTTTTTTTTHNNYNGSISGNDNKNDNVASTPLPPPPSVIPSKTLNYRDLNREILDAVDPLKLPAVDRGSVSNSQSLSSRRTTPRGENGKGPAGFTSYMRRYKACARLKGISPTRAYCSTRSRIPPSDNNNNNTSNNNTSDSQQSLPAPSVSKDSLTTTPVPLPTLRSRNTTTASANTTDDRLRSEPTQPQSLPSSETPLSSELPELVPTETNTADSASADVRDKETGEGSSGCAAVAGDAETTNGETQEAASQSAETSGSSPTVVDRGPGWTTSSELQKQVEEKLKRRSSPDYGEGAAGLYRHAQKKEGSRDDPRMKGRRRNGGGREGGGGRGSSSGGGGGGRMSGHVSGRSVAAASGGGKRALGDIVSAHRMHELLSHKDDRTLPYTYYRTAVSRDAATLENVNLESPKTEKQPQTARL